MTVLKKIPYLPFSAPYFRFFFFFFFSDKFLYLLKYRWDVKLKPVLIYCSVFNPLGSGFIHLPEHFLVIVAISWLLILSPLKKWWKLLCRDCYQVNLKNLLYNFSSDEWHREPTLAPGMHRPYHLLSSYETQLKVVSASKMYLQRDTQFLFNNEIKYTMPFYLNHSRSWAIKWSSSYHFPLKRPSTIFL